MALENALIAKIAGGVAVTGGTVGVGIVYRENIFALFRSNSHSYLIVKATDASDQPSATSLKHGSEKNYECKIQNVVDAVDCEIVEVKFENTKKTIDISALNELSAEGETEGTVFSNNATNKYFKLKIDKTKLDSINITAETPKTIDLVLKNASEADKSKKYAKLTPEFQVVNDVVSTKSKDLLLAVKVAEGTGDVDTTFTNYKCTSGEIFKNATDCEIFKFSNPDVSDTTPLKDVDFSKLSATKLSSTSDLTTSLTKDKLKIVKLTASTSQSLNKSWKSEMVKFASSDTSKKSWSFTSISRIYGTISAPTNGIFILEK